MTQNGLGGNEAAMVVSLQFAIPPLREEVDRLTGGDETIRSGLFGVAVRSAMEDGMRPITPGSIRSAVRAPATDQGIEEWRDSYKTQVLEEQRAREEARSQGF